ncbi:hypothetical protein VCRA2117O380_150117 [Vibrio crassostreae]|nr:hypothetical protein VCRA2113O200_120116 [Vibrio crassostreae]CAK1771750.1 hypothetical protein VCRA2113O194_140116 [Vibrio crassostreae]CAK1772556.1 hypothetical protein VCRA2117O39_140119 [Vibrio crassostreae]CAK1796043.1 hypothetical protein VCRA2117O380_150117 [Vibrio crassostreae]CAK2409461.1 hypothetical protein VCRA2110O179_130116 [Vibrio crassostreae]
MAKTTALELKIDDKPLPDGAFMF